VAYTNATKLLKHDSHSSGIIDISLILVWEHGLQWAETAYS